MRKVLLMAQLLGLVALAAALPAQADDPSFLHGYMVALYPDLVVEAVQMAPVATPDPAHPCLRMTVIVRNQGNMPAGGFFVTLHPHADGTGLCARWWVPELGAGTKVQLAVKIPAPAEATTFVAVADPPDAARPNGRVLESPGGGLMAGEANNTRLQAYSGDPAHPYP